MGEISEAIRRARSETKPPQTPPPKSRSEGDGETARRLWPRLDAVGNELAEAIAPTDRKTHPLSREADSLLPSRVCLHDATSPAAQNYRRLAFRLQNLASERGLRSFAVTSVLPREGKTTIICNLAVELSRVDQSRNVALVEMDLRRPMIGASLGLTPEVGVESLLAGDASVEEVAIQTELPGFDVLPVKTAMRDPDACLTSDRLKTCFEALHSSYSVVMIDTPPLVVGSDSNVILRHADAAMLVAVSGQTPTRKMKAVLEQLPSEKLVATILNYANPRTDDVKYAAYYHHEDAGSGR